MFINYQGYLTDTTGEAITGSLAMQFSIFALSTGGTALWSQGHTVAVENGVFNVKLAFAAVDTSLFMPGSRRWVQLRVGIHTLLPRTEITSTAYSMRSVYCDNSDRLDGRHANQFIYNGTAMQSGADYWISGGGRAEEQLAAYANGLAGSAAVIGDATDDNVGVYGNSEEYIGVYGRSDSSTGVFGISSDGGAFAVRGHNSNTSGTGVAGAGCNDTLFYLTCGSGGTFSSRHIALFAYAHDTNGTGVAVCGNRIADTVYMLAGGSGGSFNGSTVGVYGLARNESGDRSGGYFTVEGPDTCFAYVASVHMGAPWLIRGAGMVAPTMGTSAGEKMLFAPVSPEPHIEDFGRAQLASGHCRVELDPLFAECVSSNADCAPMVFITLNDDCNGVYVKTDATGFDVSELAGGTSDAAFSYRVVGTRAGAEHLRFPAASSPMEKVATPIGSAPVDRTPVR